MQIKEGTDVVSLIAAREKPQIKRTNLPARIKADQMKLETGIHEVILVNEKGLITEGSRSNIFFIKNNELYTPQLDLVLPGITQSKIFEVAAKNKIQIHITEIKLEEAGNFIAAFISSTSNQVLPLRRLDNFKYNPGNPVIEILSTGFKQAVEKNLAQFSW